MKKIELYKEHHSRNPSYGQSFNVHYPYIGAIVSCLGSTSVIDYGCGNNLLIDRFRDMGVGNAVGYDPAIPGIDQLPDEVFDCLVNTDVLEHIPENELPGVLEEFKKLSNTAIIIPHLGKAKAILPNGENAHCTIKTPAEWSALLQRYYKHVQLLPHHSRMHATFLCSDRDLNYRAIDNIVSICYYLRTRYTIKRFAETRSFGQRARMALKILRGKGAFSDKTC